MHHSFDINLAAIYGINAAIIIHHFQHWISVNRRLKRNFHDGRTWSYQSFDEIAAHFPYFSKDQVRDAISLLCNGKTRRSKNDELCFEPVLMKANYNKTPFDRTLWYAFIDEEKFSNSSYERANDQIEKNNCPDPKEQSPTPIPDTKPDPLPDTRTTTDAALAVPLRSAVAASFHSEDLEQKFKEEVYRRLEKIPGLPPSQIKYHKKNSTDLAKLANAIDYVTTPGRKFTDGLPAALTWAYANNITPKTPKPVKTEENRLKSKKLQTDRENRGLHDFIAGKDGIEVISSTGANCIFVAYDDNEFNEKATNAIKKYKLKP